MFYVIIITLCAQLISATIMETPNVCKNSIDYFYMDGNPNCWFNPDVNSTLEQIIRNRGYPFESYKITSKDGYITDLYRIPRDKPNKGVIYLLHPATVTSAVWIDKGRNGSLGFILYDAGFDVWLGNSRGSDYGNEHVTLSSINDPEYWDFTFHEMAVYDLPKNLEFIKNITNSKIAFVGHSMGSTVGYIYAAMLPEHSKEHVNVHVLLSAGGLFNKVKVLFLEQLSHFIYILYDILKSINYNVIFTKDRRDVLSNVALNFCRTPFGLNVCPNLVRLTLGITDKSYHDPEFLKSFNYNKIISKEDIASRIMLTVCKTSFGFNACPILARIVMGVTETLWDPSYVPVAFAHYPGGVPLKAYIHYGQWLSSSRLIHRMFDYGKYKNRKIYNSNAPPKYPYHLIKTPIYLWSARNDYLSTPEGVEDFYKMIPDEAKIFGQKMFNEYNHADMLLALDVADVIYKPLAKFLETLFANKTLS